MLLQEARRVNSYAIHNPTPLSPHRRRIGRSGCSNDRNTHTQTLPARASLAKRFLEHPSFLDTTSTTNQRKTQLISVRDEYEQFKESIHRWRADAEVKWRGLKRASDAATRRAKNSEKSGDAAELELAALKSAFRSFLKTLWDDLRSRPVPLLSPVVGAGFGVGPASCTAAAGPGGRPDVGSSSSGSGTKSRVRPQGSRERGRSAVAIFDGESSGLSSTSRVSWMEEASDSPAAVAVPSTNEHVCAGLAKATAAMATAVAEEGVDDHVAASAKGGGSSPFAELTEAEVSDIMQALSVGEGGADSFLLSTSSSLSSFHDPSWAETTGKGAAAIVSSSPRQRHSVLGSEGKGREAMPAATQPTLPAPDSGAEKEEMLGDSKSFVEQDPPFVDHKRADFEGKEAFADRVELALGGSDPSAALAVMLRSLRASSFSKAVADGSVGSESFPPAPLAREETRLSRSWPQPGTTLPGFSSNGEDTNLAERSPMLHYRASSPVKAARLDSYVRGSTGGEKILSPLEETPSASDTAALGSFGPDAFQKLMVEDLVSSS